MYEMAISVELDELENLTRLWPVESLAVRRKKISEAALLLQREVVLKAPEGAGPIHLRDTISSSVSIGEPVTGFVGTPAVYGEPVEFGTKPHFPPLAPLQFWVEKKLRIDNEKRAKSIAFAIARKISRRGTQGAGMFQKGLEKSVGRIMAILRRIPGEIVRRSAK